MEDEVDVGLPAPRALQQPALLAQLEQLVRLHLLAAPAALAEGAVVAKYVVQRGARVEAVLAHREPASHAAHEHPRTLCKSRLKPPPTQLAAAKLGTLRPTELLKQSALE